jgi:hypothetical protein
MTDTERNRKAAAHGKEGEAVALRWLLGLTSPDNIKVVNMLLDFTILDTPVEVKACSATIRGEPKQPERFGRFTLDEEQHAMLRHGDGYYLFVVLEPMFGNRLFFVRANDLPYHRQISWKVAKTFEKTFSDTGLGVSP